MGNCDRRRILIVRLSAIGDIVFASPLVGALRRAYPQAHIAWLVQPGFAPLLAQHPDLDEVIVWPLTQWLDLWRSRRWRDLVRAVWRFRAELRERRFDLALDLQGLLKSGVLTWFSGARERVGLGSREGSGWLMTRIVPRGGEPKRVGSEYLYLAQDLGLPTDPFEMAVHYGPAEADRAAALIQAHGLGAGYAVICPFTTRPQKHWFSPRWGELARRLKADLGLPVVMLGGPADRDAAWEVCAAGHQGADQDLVNLVGQTSLLEAAALIHNAALVVAVDTGLGHMGIAYGRPSLLLFGSTCPYLETTRGNARVLYHRLPCSPCKRRPTCNGAFTCMGLITVDEVVSAARALMVADRDVRHVRNARPEMLLHSGHVPHPCGPGAVSDEAGP